MFSAWHQFRHSEAEKVPNRKTNGRRASRNYSSNSAEWEATRVPSFVIDHEQVTPRPSLLIFTLISNCVGAPLGAKKPDRTFASTPF